MRTANFCLSKKIAACIRSFLLYSMANIQVVCKRNLKEQKTFIPVAVEPSGAHIFVLSKFPGFFRMSLYREESDFALADVAGEHYLTGSRFLRCTPFLRFVVNHFSGAATLSQHYTASLKDDWTT